ncbi:podoplanin-like isoform X1 [Scyliorhinus canicula]|uniref:podoplanin-like isoform X1 n=1 Tax=Scyliorhinus canicula TaxID=7830 RepID=UPI0018F34EF7|nr:podoplanin-like isoform X1 [Scyliorhinus canicula]
MVLYVIDAERADSKAASVITSTQMEVFRKYLQDKPKTKGNKELLKDNISDEGELVTVGGTEEKNDSVVSATISPGSERIDTDEDSNESSTATSTESNSTEDGISDIDDADGKDFLEMLTLIGIIVGAIVAVIIVLTIVVVIIKKMSGGYSP